MAALRQRGDRHRYDVMDGDCIGRECLVLGPFTVMGAVGNGGYRNTGDVRFCCLTRAYHGCPQPLPAHEPELAAERRREGMRNA